MPMDVNLRAVGIKIPSEWGIALNIRKVGWGLAQALLRRDLLMCGNLCQDSPGYPRY